MDERSREHTGERSEELDRLLAEYLDRREEGLGFDDWARSQGDGADELRERYERYLRIEGVLDRAIPPLGLFSAFFHRQRRSGSPESTGGERPLDVKAGDELGEFRLVGRLGRGGMGEVWEAEQQGVGRRVALKLMVPRDDGGRRADRFDLEPIALGRLSHPGVVAVFAAGEHDGVRWIAQELVPGGSTLQDFIRESRAETRPRDFDQRVAELFVTLADALQHVHEVGVLHRDVKPRNILVTPHGEPKLADFGLARVSDDQSLSGSRHLLGTVPYMSPEQVAGEDLDPRSDVFSLGVVLYEVLTGERPFQGESQARLMMQIAHAEPLDARAHRGDIDPDLAAICAKALEKRPAERYQSAGELADDLVRFVRGEATHARPAGPLRRARKWARRNRALLLSAAAVLAVAAPLLLLVDESRAGRREAERQQLLESAGRWFDRGAVAQGVAEAERAIALDPRDPAGYQAMAIGLSRAGWHTEAHAALQRARGWEELPDEARLETPLDHLTYGIHVLVLREPERYASAISHLERATRDEKLRPLAWHALYQLRRDGGDLDGARDALERYLESLPSGTPIHRLSRAELYELEAMERAGAARRDLLREALAEMDGVLADERFDPAELEPLLIGKRRGRVLIELGRFEEAARTLERHVEQRPRDAVSRANLALALYGLSREPSRGATEREELRARAEAEARRAARIGAGAGDAWSLIGAIAVDRLAEAADGSDPRERPEWRTLEECVQRLRAHDPDAVQARELRINLLVLEAGWLTEAGELEGALSAWQGVVELRPDHLLAWIRLGVLLNDLERPDEALDALHEARALWDASPVGDEPALDDSTLADWNVAQLGAASEDPRNRAEALEARDALRELLREDRRVPVTHRALFAWYLAKATDEAVRDCALARELCAELREELGAAIGAELDSHLDEVEAACP